MTMTLAPPAPRTLPPDLQVDRSEILFRNVSPRHVLIELTVRNHGRGRSRPQTAQIQAARLGAFVPWRPLKTVVVPALDPGAAVVLPTNAASVGPPPAARPDRVSPARLLTALDLVDRRADEEAVDAGSSRMLPADPFRLLGREGVHWAGNLNIFLGGRQVERHLAQALRIYPGRVNLAMFVVGSGADAYAFSLKGDGATWETRLYDATSWMCLRPEKNTRPVALGQWVHVGQSSPMILALRPPADCGIGSVEVHVKQQSTGDEAIVEFSLDANAAGAGCYVV